jgi:anionic cell wall polymer biosynthesis LytR-Cps2A-Psr (LCP) family protein
MRYGRNYLLQKPPPARKKRRLLLLLAAAMMLVLAVVLAFSIISSFNSFHNGEAWAQALRKQRQGDDVIYLLYGIDYWGANPYVERLVMVYHDHLAQKVNLIYIPGNTLVETAERGPEPLGQVYRHLQKSAFINLVQDITGLPVHHYLELNYQVLAVLGESLGGLETTALTGAPGAGLFLPDKDYLSGFELYRYFITAERLEPPFEQIARQQRVLVQLMHKLERKKIWQLPGLFNRAAPFVETDLTWREFNALRERFGEYAFADARLVLLPGEEELRDGRLFWVTQPAAVREMVRSINEGYLVRPGDVKVEVLNGSGISGLAAVLSGRLEEEGFQVVKTGNADHFNYTTSLVIARRETVDKGRAVSLFVAGSSLVHRYDPGSRVDVTVIIGSDYAKYED